MSTEVDRWFASKKLPLADVMQRIVKLVVAAGLTAYEKYGTLNFAANGSDMAGFVQLADTARVSLMFMRAGKLTGNYPSLEGKAVKYLRFASAADVDKCAKELNAICAEWIVLSASVKPSPKGPAPKKTPARKPSSKKAASKKKKTSAKKAKKR